MKRKFLMVMSVGTLLTVAHSQTTAKVRENPKVLAVIHQAESLPIEFRADLELNAIESGKVLGQAQKRRLLESLFQSAPSAHDPLKLRNAVQVPDLRSIKVTTAHTLNLDSLSIRTRVVDNFLKVDKLSARRLWSDIQLSVPTSTCRSPYVYDLSGYYSSLRGLLSNGFTRAEIGTGAPVSLLQQEIQRASSPMQLEELLTLAAEVSQSDELLSRTAFLLNGLLQQEQASDRELGAISATLPLALTNFARLLKQRGEDPSPLINAYRSFLVRSAMAGTCEVFPSNRRELAQGFNTLRTAVKIEAPPLDEKDLKSEHTLGPLEADHIPEGSEFNGMLRPLMALQDAKGADKGLNFPAAESDALQFLAKIDALNTNSSPCHACAFHEKADFYLVLLDFAPDKEITERTANHLAQFLAQDGMEQESPLEWLFRVKLLLNFTRQPNENQKRNIEEVENRGIHLSLPPDDARKEISQAMQLGGNDVMSLYVSADQAFKNPYVLPPL